MWSVAPGSSTWWCDDITNNCFLVAYFGRTGASSGLQLPGDCLVMQQGFTTHSGNCGLSLPDLVEPFLLCSILGLYSCCFEQPLPSLERLDIPKFKDTRESVHMITANWTKNVPLKVVALLLRSGWRASASVHPSIASVPLAVCWCLSFRPRVSLGQEAIFKFLFCKVNHFKNFLKWEVCNIFNGNPLAGTWLCKM